MRRVAITGMGIISPVGNTWRRFYHQSHSRKIGNQENIPDFDDRLSIRIAAQTDFSAEQHFTKKNARTLDRVSQFALAAASQAWKDAGMGLSEAEIRRSGVYLGTGMGGARTLEDSYEQLFRQQVNRLHPLTVVMVMNMPQLPASPLARPERPLSYIFHCLLIFSSRYRRGLSLDQARIR